MRGELTSKIHLVLERLKKIMIARMISASRFPEQPLDVQNDTAKESFKRA